MEEKKGHTLQGILSKLLEHPEQLLGVLHLIGSFTSGDKGETDTTVFLPEEEVSQEEDETTLDTVEEVFAEGTENTDIAQEPVSSQNEETVAVSARPKHRRREMLVAIKPYIKDSKRGQVDRILHAAELVELLRE